MKFIVIALYKIMHIIYNSEIIINIRNFIKWNQNQQSSVSYARLIKQL